LNHGRNLADRKNLFFGKNAENPYIKRRPAMGRFIRERPEGNNLLLIADLSHFLWLIAVRDFYRDCGKPLIASDLKSERVKT
jgi:hypothetical protein